MFLPYFPKLKLYKSFVRVIFILTCSPLRQALWGIYVTANYQKSLTVDNVLGSGKKEPRVSRISETIWRDFLVGLFRFVTAVSCGVIKCSPKALGNHKSRLVIYVVFSCPWVCGHVTNTTSASTLLRSCRLAMLCKKRCFWKFHKIYRKASGLRLY